MNIVRKRSRPVPKFVFVASTALLALTAGCQFAPTALEDVNNADALDAVTAVPDESQSNHNGATTDAVLARSEWVQRVRLVEDELQESRPVWRHAALEDLLSRPPESRPRFERWLGDANAIIAGNAAIAAARVGGDIDPQSLAKGLGETVRNPELAMRMRLAAAEALGGVSGASVADVLKSLVAQYSGASGGEGATPQADLHAALIGAALRYGISESDSIFSDALQSVSPRVQLAALRAWPQDGEQPLPESILELTTAARPEIRIAALELLAARRSPEAMKALERAINDHYAQVRLTAIAGLGDFGDESAVALLEEIVASGNVTMQAAAIGALADLGAHESVIDAADSEHWQVRRAVAAALAYDASRSALAIARRLLGDSNGQVAQQMAATLGDWPAKISAPLLIDSLESTSFSLRTAAAAALNAQWPTDWPAARPFRPAADAAERQEQIAALRDQWEMLAGDVFEESADRPAEVQEASVSDETMQNVAARLAQLVDPSTPTDEREQHWAALVEVGSPLVVALQRLIDQSGQGLPDDFYRHVLPRVDETFQSLAELESDEVRIRRQAAETLAEQTAKNPLSRLALARLVALVTLERDALVWQTVQRALADDAREPAVRLHYAGLSHPTAEVRRRACESLGAHAQPQHQVALIKALDDDNADVVRAAATALAGCGPLENPLPLGRLLASRETATRLAAARTLAMLDFEEGEAALERLAHDDDFNVRRRAAVAMGEVGRTSFTSALLSLLDDRLGVRRAALASLAQVHEIDFAKDDRGRDVPIDRQTVEWRRWFEQRSQTQKATHESNDWRPERAE